MDPVQVLITSVTNSLHNFFAELTSFWLLLQLATLLAAGAIGSIAVATVRSRVNITERTMGWPPVFKLLARAFVDSFGTIVFILITFTAHQVMLSMTWPSRSYFVGVAVSLATAWVVITLVTSLIRNHFVHRIVAVSAWTIAALDIVGLRERVWAALDSFGVVFAGFRLTPLLALKATVILLFAVWIANLSSDFIDRRLRTVTDLTPSVQALIAKVVRIFLLVIAIVIALSSVGIDLSALAFFSGAIGVGLGFGLQKIVSNLVSGIILLADKSIKPGDVISVGDHFGRVSNMGARFTSVDTRDGREFLIPNEDFITQRVANWTYSSNLVRLSAKFNTTYDSDPRKAQTAAIEAALSVDRVVKMPLPQCMLTAFGATSMEYELTFWVTDPDAGITNVKSDVLLALWDTLAGKGVKIPRPGPSRVIYELAQEDEPDPPKDQDDAPAPKSPFPG